MRAFLFDRAKLPLCPDFDGERSKAIVRTAKTSLRSFLLDQGGAAAPPHL
jgi:hypothetical protein